ncbi:MAG TPA: DUF1059 domain-containing protein [Polyangiaceae bacterium]|nr:DUF1059 domain-containing protein [Polyangiaceae bacterium]
MKEFSCGDVVPGCTAKFRCNSDEEVLREVAAHARDAHGIKDVPPELIKVVREHIRSVQA